jgi:hypothetical protein
VSIIEEQIVPQVEPPPMPPPPRTPVNLDPLTTYEVLTRQMVDDLTREVLATRQRVDTMFYLVIGSIVLDVLVRLSG